jgi:transcriptional regulator with XRE-family HTH domain
MSSIIGSRIREVRRSKGIGYVELSHKTGIDKDEINKMELGEIPIIAFNLSRIANAFDVTIESLIRNKK